MINKYLKYIYAIAIFYIIWLVFIPLGFRFLANPIIDGIKKNTNIEFEVEKPRITTYIVPNINLKAKNIKILNNEKITVLELNNLKVNIRLLPLLTKKIHINYIGINNINTTLDIKDDLYLGDYKLDIKKQNTKFFIKKVKLNNYNIELKNNYIKDIFIGKNIYFKNGNKRLIARGNTEFIKNGYEKSNIDFNISYPKNRNLSKTKFNININNFDIGVFSNIVSKCLYKEIDYMSGKININSDNKHLDGDINNIKIIYKDKVKSIIFPNKLILSTDYKIKKNSMYIDNLSILGDGINTSLSGEIKNIISSAPIFDLKTKLNNIDLRKVALILPPIITDDISIPKLKQYPFYANMNGDIRIKGKFPTPDMYGLVKVTDGVLVKQIPRAVKGAEITINLDGQMLLLDVVVSAGDKEYVYVTGDLNAYGEKLVHLDIKSSKNVDLNVAEHVLNPLHEILQFEIGPVPIMDIEGRGNIDIKVVGTKKDPHIWGDFYFNNTNARFLEVNNLVLKNASGNLNFNNQNAHFVNKTGTLNGKPMKIDGVCTLFGNLDFNVNANGQNLNNLIVTLTTSPMLEDMKSLVPPMTDIKGQADLYLNLKGKVKHVEDIKLNETIIPSGYIKLLGNSLNLHGIKNNNVKGIINYYKNNCDFNLESSLSSNSRAKMKGSIKDGIGNISINAPKLCVNELETQKLKPLDKLLINLNANYKGSIKNPEIAGIDAIIDIIKDNKPVKNSKIQTGKIVIKNSNITITNLTGRVKQNPFSLNLSAKNIGKTTLDLKNAKVNGQFNCKEFDLSNLNYIIQMKILPDNIQKELEKINIINGKANIVAQIKNSKINSNLNLDNIDFKYYIEEGVEKEKVAVPINMINGQIILNNNIVRLHKLNCLVDNMPILIYGEIKNVYNNPNYNIRINSKLVQNVFDNYWNSNNIYPIKMQGDILFYSNIIGNNNYTQVKTDVRMEENSTIYYMGATLGDKLNPITINTDIGIDKQKNIKINKFKYNKLISSQNNRQNILPLVSVQGEIKNYGSIFGFKNLLVKTDNPTNANLFNIIFKKPTIKSGNFTSDLRINGTSKNPKIVGKFNVVNMEMPYINTTVKGLDIEFKPDNIVVTSKGEVLSNYVMVNAKIKNNFDAPYVINDANVYINELNLNRSMNQFKQMELKGLSSAISTDTVTTGNDLLSSFVINNINVRAGSIKVKNIKASNLEAKCSLNNKMKFSVDNFMFNMASGIITGKIGYNLLNNYMDMELDAKDVNANALTIALFDLPNQIYGDLTGKIKLSCNATNDKTRLETLNGKAEFDVSQGRMPKLGSLEYLLKAGNLIKGGITSLSMNGIIDIITPMKTGDFSSIKGHLKIKNGITEEFEINSHGKDLNLYITGQFNFPTQVADMKVFGQISRKISTVLGAAGNLSLNTLFNKIPGVELDENSQFINDLNKIPGIELSNKSSRKFVVDILGDINGDDFVKSFKWIN